MFKDNDISILYHPGKKNVIADSLSQKAVNMSISACISVSQMMLTGDISLAKVIIFLDISYPRWILSIVKSRSSLFKEI